MTSPADRVRDIRVALTDAMREAFRPKRSRTWYPRTCWYKAADAPTYQHHAHCWCQYCKADRNG